MKYKKESNKTVEGYTKTSKRLGRGQASTLCVITSEESARCHYIGPEARLAGLLDDPALCVIQFLHQHQQKVRRKECGSVTVSPPHSTSVFSIVGNAIIVSVD
jgi:hypothetical protein